MSFRWSPWRRQRKLGVPYLRLTHRLAGPRSTYPKQPPRRQNTPHLTVTTEFWIAKDPSHSHLSNRQRNKHNGTSSPFFRALIPPPTRRPPIPMVGWLAGRGRDDGRWQHKQHSLLPRPVSPDLPQLRNLVFDCTTLGTTHTVAFKEQPWITPPRPPQTTAKHSSSLTSAETAASTAPPSATSCAHAARTQHSPRSPTLSAA